MAPALRMTRSIKEKLKIFLQFDSDFGLPFLLFFGIHLTSAQHFQSCLRVQVLNTPIVNMF